MVNYVITLDQAKRLVELGFKQDSMIFWFEFKRETCLIFKDTEEFLDRDYLTELKGYYPAYHVGELLEILPNEIDNGEGNYFLTKQGQVRGYRTVTDQWLIQIQGSRTEAEAFGQILIYLLENKIL